MATIVPKQYDLIQHLVDDTSWIEAHQLTSVSEYPDSSERNVNNFLYSQPAFKNEEDKPRFLAEMYNYGYSNQIERSIGKIIGYRVGKWIEHEKQFSLEFRRRFKLEEIKLKYQTEIQSHQQQPLMQADPARYLEENKISMFDVPRYFRHLYKHEIQIRKLLKIVELYESFQREGKKFHFRFL